ncbi:30S ribosomal protein S20 [Fuchsiella alkaliacetigena]|uniref:30S ribosomal protein S20 n=1 Tax=Fuchsiella alkaliacetigena TaxID=957042 RepID=UPI00200A6975|nr:30S ribosomal protein S20 [Fuchsiella alkaliacetigena]MCK8825208.1 30S ribosomal protein S20 [Fuchsiella alkaliacetigena]
MPSSDSAAKRARVAEKKRKRNKALKLKIKDAVKDFETAIENQDKDLAEEKLREAKQIIDKSTSKGLFHKNTAARKKSKLDRQFNKLA